MTDFWWIFEKLDWQNVFDIGLVSLVFFLLLYLVRSTQAVPLLRGAVFIIIAVALLSSLFRLLALSWLLRRTIPALLVAIPVVFQPELRRALERVGRVSSLLVPAKRESDKLDQVIRDTVRACQILGRRRFGALIVLERETGLQEFAETGVMLNADYSVELLLTIFDPNTPLHDGGVIVRNGRILVAATVLPLTTAFLADRRMGLRHRAGIGITEATDAIAIIVSEERGSTSVAHNGRIIRRLDDERLESVLRAFYQNKLGNGLPRGLGWLRQTVRLGHKG